MAYIPSYLLSKAESGDRDAMFEVGNEYIQDDEFREGFKWLKKAADSGEPRAMMMIAAARAQGLDIKYGF